MFESESLGSMDMEFGAKGDELIAALDQVEEKALKMKRAIKLPERDFYWEMYTDDVVEAGEKTEKLEEQTQKLGKEFERFETPIEHVKEAVKSLGEEQQKATQDSGLFASGLMRIGRVAGVPIRALQTLWQIMSVGRTVTQASTAANVAQAASFSLVTVASNGLKASLVSLKALIAFIGVAGAAMITAIAGIALGAKAVYDALTLESRVLERQTEELETQETIWKRIAAMKAELKGDEGEIDPLAGRREEIKRMRKQAEKKLEWGESTTTAYFMEGTGSVRIRKAEKEKAAVEAETQLRELFDLETALVEKMEANKLAATERKAIEFALFLKDLREKARNAEAAADAKERHDEEVWQAAFAEKRQATEDEERRLANVEYDNVLRRAGEVEAEKEEAAGKEKERLATIADAKMAGLEKAAIAENKLNEEARKKQPGFQASFIGLAEMGKRIQAAAASTTPAELKDIAAKALAAEVDRRRQIELQESIDAGVKAMKAGFV